MTMAKKEMDTLIIGDQEFEVVDSAAREDVDAVEVRLDNMLLPTDQLQKRLSVGLNLSSRKIVISIPEDLDVPTALQEVNIAVSDNGSRLYEKYAASGQALFVFCETDGHTYMPFVNDQGNTYSEYTVPSTFGSIVTLNKNSLLYPYITYDEDKLQYVVTDTMELLPIGKSSGPDTVRISDDFIDTGSGTTATVSNVAAYKCGSVISFRLHYDNSNGSKIKIKDEYGAPFAAFVFLKETSGDLHPYPLISGVNMWSLDSYDQEGDIFGTYVCGEWGLT